MKSMVFSIPNRLSGPRGALLERVPLRKGCERTPRYHDKAPQYEPNRSLQDMTGRDRKARDTLRTGRT